MRADQDIPREVKEQLAGETGIDTGEIGVAGIVALGGLAQSILENYDAERAAERIIGVVGLANDIGVHPRDQRTDSEIAHAESKRCKPTRLFQGKLSSVVKDGTVTLEGELERADRTVLCWDLL